MLRLQADGYPAVLPALQRVPINHLFARSVLERKVVGQAWVDRAEAPTLAHVIHPYGMTLLFGNADAIDPAVLKAHLLGLGTDGVDRWLQASPQALPPLVDRWLDVAPAAPDEAPGGPRVQLYTRQNFRFDAQCPAAQRDPAPLPAGVRLRPLVAGDFALPDIAVSPHKFWTDAEQFLAHGGGWAVDSDGELAAMAFTSFRFDRQLEIGVETRARHRGRGFARLAARALIDQCRAQDLEPVWACRKENVGSHALALALGFEPTVAVPYYRLPGTSAA
jgi:RimJ/RimL family protein N-acetyltransferase